MVPLRLNFGSVLGLCWAIWRLFKNPRKILLFYACFFWAHFGAFLGLYSLLCWAILGLCWALLAAFGPKISTPTEAWFRWGWILGQFWAYVGPFGGYLKTRVKFYYFTRVFWAHFGAFLGLYSLLCWAILGLCWALLAAFGPKISTPTEAWLRWGWILGRFRAQNRLKTSCAIYLLILK